MVNAPTRNRTGRAAPAKPGLLLVIAIVAGFWAGEANAFSLFGIHLWGEKPEEVETVEDPVHYTVSFSIQGGGGELSDFLKKRSELVNGEKQPVDGDLGLVVKARDDVQILIGSLYEKAYYGGLVNISVEGQNIEDIVGLPDFDRVNPVPVTISIQAGPQFTFSKIDLQGDAATFDAAKLGLVTAPRPIRPSFCRLHRRSHRA